MLAFALDHPTLTTFFLITGDRDYAYAVSTLKLRKYQVILVVPSSPHTSPSLESQASLVIDWATAVLRTRTETANPTQPVRQPYFDIDATIVTKLLRDLQEFPLDDPETTLHPQGPSKLRRVTTQDLLEPSRHPKNTESFDATWEFTLNPASSKKSTITGCDSTHGGLPIPKTPSRSRHASVSAGSTRARSTTTVAQSPPVLDQYALSKNPPPFTARRPSTPDVTDVPNPSQRSVSVLTSLDPLELPLHDDRPPSSIIVRSPLVTGQSPCDMPGVPGKPSIPSSHKLNTLASPFLMTRDLPARQSAPNQQSHTAVRSTSPFVVPAKTLTVCGTPQKNPKEVEHLTALRIESTPHRGAGLTKSNDHPCVGSYTTHSLPTRNVGLHFTDTPSSKHVSLPAAGFLDVGDGIDPVQFAAFSYASNMHNSSVLGFVPASSSVSPSTPSAITESHQTDEGDRCQTWSMFRPLIHLLLAAQERGIVRPSRSIIALDLVKTDEQVYRRAGVSRFRDYTALAEQAGIIELGGKEGDAWIALHPNWFGMNEITTTQFISNRPTFDPPKTTQDPLLTGSEMIETAAIIQALGPRSLSSSDTSPTSPINRHNSASEEFFPEFQPLIDTLARMRAEGFHQPRRSVVGQMLNPVIYSQAGVSGFKEYIQRASEAQVVECGGVGGFAWISLHPELRS